LAFERLVSSLTRDNLWLYILKMLNEQPTYPLDLKKKFQHRFHFSPATITFYVVLYKLRREGLVETFQDDRRKLYRCTGKGLKILQEGIHFIDRTSSLLKPV